MEQQSPRPEAAWPKCAASMAVFRGDTVLLVERGQGRFKGYWSLPGGHIESGEAARAAALREVVEETGVTAGIEGLLDVHEVIMRGSDDTLRAHYLIVVFYGRWQAGEPMAGGDAAVARFVELAQLAAYPLTEGAAAFIQRAWDLLQRR
jgi:8-oxo-dGTP diphosphatase